MNVFIKNILVILIGLTLTPALVKAGGAHQTGVFVGLDSEPAKVVIQFHNALKEKNKELALSLLDDNVLIYEGGRVERSAAEYAHHHLASDIAFISSVDVTTLEHQVKVYGDMAISSSRTKVEGKYKGKTINRSGMETILLKKVNKEWKIINIHWSN